MPPQHGSAIKVQPHKIPQFVSQPLCGGLFAYPFLAAEIAQWIWIVEGWLLHVLVDLEWAKANRGIEGREIKLIGRFQAKCTQTMEYKVNIVSED